MFKKSRRFNVHEHPLTLECDDRCRISSVSYRFSGRKPQKKLFSSRLPCTAPIMEPAIAAVLSASPVLAMSRSSHRSQIEPPPTIHHHSIRQSSASFVVAFELIRKAPSVSVCKTPNTAFYVVFLHGATLTQGVFTGYVICNRRWSLAASSTMRIPVKPR